MSTAKKTAGKAAAKESNVKTALRVIEIIEIFAKEGRPLSLSELSRLLEAPVSSCLALIRTLNRLGYLYEVGRRQGYYPTSRLLAMAQRIEAADPILHRIRPSLEELRNATQETVVLGKLNLDNEVVYVEVVSSHNPIRYVAVAGTRRTIYANSIGKALLGSASSEERQAILATVEFQKYTEKTLTSVETLEADLAASLERGWYQNMGESIHDVGALAWPLTVFDTRYAISIAGPVYRIQENLEQYAERLRVACLFIENGN